MAITKDSNLMAPGPPLELAPALAPTPTDGTGPLFPFTWPDDGAPRLQWKKRSPGSTPLRPFDADLLDDALDGVLALVQLAQRHAPLRQLLQTRTSQDALASLGATPGGEAFQSSLDRLLLTQGLRCGDNPGNEWEPVGPSWLEEPSLVVAIVQRYCSQDVVPVSPDEPVRPGSREAALARRDGRTHAIRDQIGDPEKRARFDLWLEAARRSVQNYEDHSYKIDSGAAALVRLALVAAGRRLAAAGRIGDVDRFRLSRDTGLRP